MPTDEPFEEGKAPNYRIVAGALEVSMPRNGARIQVGGILAEETQRPSRAAGAGVALFGGVGAGAGLTGESPAT
jgi:hypothetical protein